MIIMGEIFVYPVYKSLAEIGEKGLNVGLCYDKDMKQLRERLKADPKFGVAFYNNLMENG